MYRRVVLYKSTWVSGAVEILYHVRGARQLSQYRETTGAYNESVTPVAMNGAVVYADSIRLRAATGITPINTFEFVLDVSENQPAEESVEEITSVGVGIDVYNEHGVLVCRNVPKTNTGEMTSVPGEEPGEMASETTDESGAMI